MFFREREYETETQRRPHLFDVGVEPTLNGNSVSFFSDPHLLPLFQTGGIQLTGRKNRYCVLAGDCIKYFAGIGEDGLPHDLKGAIELNRGTQVEVKDARMLIVRVAGSFLVNDAPRSFFGCFQSTGFLRPLPGYGSFSFSLRHVALSLSYCGTP